MRKLEDVAKELNEYEALHKQLWSDKRYETNEQKEERKRVNKRRKELQQEIKKYQMRLFDD